MPYQGVICFFVGAAQLAVMHELRLKFITFAVAKLQPCAANTSCNVVPLPSMQGDTAAVLP